MENINIPYVKQVCDEQQLNNHITGEGNLYVNNGNKTIYFTDREYGVCLRVKNGKYVDGNSKYEYIPVKTSKRVQQILIRFKNYSTEKTKPETKPKVKNGASKRQIEYAEQLGITTNSTGVLLHRARARLKESIALSALDLE